MIQAISAVPQIEPYFQGNTVDLHKLVSQKWTFCYRWLESQTYEKVQWRTYWAKVFSSHVFMETMFFFKCLYGNNVFSNVFMETKKEKKDTECLLINMWSM